MKFCCALLLLIPSIAAGSEASDSVLMLQALKVDTSLVGPVTLGNDTLFALQAGVRGYSAQKRAEAVGRRIIETLAESGVPLDSLAVLESEVSSDIVVGDHLLLSVVDIDASLKGTTRSDLAQRYARAIRTGVERYREDRSKTTLLQGALLSAAATIVLVMILRLLSWLRRRLENALDARVRGITIQKQEFIRADWLKSALRLTARLVKWVLVILLIYAYLEFVLTRFIWTRAFANSLLDLTLQPLIILGSSAREYLPNFFFLIVLFFLTRYVLKFLRILFVEVEKGRIVLPGFFADWAMPTFKIVRILVAAFAAVVAFPYIPGSNSPAFQGTSIFIGVLVSLGSTSAVGNVVAGVILTYTRSFRVGEIVQIQDALGMVVSRGLLVTRIRTPKNVEVTIPNATVLGVHVSNYSVRAKEGKLILPTSVTIGYDAPWRQVHALLLRAADKTDGVLKDPEPFVLQKSLDDFYVRYELNVYTTTPEEMLRIFSDLHKNIQDTFNEYGVQIMSPNFVADRESPPVVPRDRWYAPPARKPGEPGADM